MLFFSRNSKESGIVRTRAESAPHKLYVICSRQRWRLAVPYHASQMYAKNLTAFLLHLGKSGQIQVNLEDEITRDTLLTRGGEVVNPRVREFFSLPALAAQKT